MTEAQKRPLKQKQNDRGIEKTTHAYFMESDS